jgi:hypothetical protein
MNMEASMGSEAAFGRVETTGTEHAVSRDFSFPYSTGDAGEPENESRLGKVHAL